MRTAIIANGEINDYTATKNALQNAEYIIACDGGLRHAEKMHILPDVIIGDMDSAPSEYLFVCKQRDIPVCTYPAEKDETDLALAMEHALSKAASSVIIFGALGGRVDHTIANFHVLVMANDIPAEIWDEKTSVQLVRKKICIAKENYQTVTLLPLSTEVTGIKTRGLVYPLNGETLKMGVVRGVSNCFSAHEAEILIESGVLLVMRSV
ncbi:MAG: thiamine diphosphokinase [Defluviitaleaceae bacterium]|nr:thiamine diphosphokinase [Defluviitaleaceae bacterium]